MANNSYLPLHNLNPLLYARMVAELFCFKVAIFFINNNNNNIIVIQVKLVQQQCAVINQGPV